MTYLLPSDATDPFEARVAGIVYVFPRSRLSYDIISVCQSKFLHFYQIGI
jgi:hypothetical protein